MDGTLGKPDIPTLDLDSVKPDGDNHQSQMCSYLCFLHSIQFKIITFGRLVAMFFGQQKRC